MINVIIPFICSEEIKYTFNCLLGEFLGLKYSFKIGQSNDHFLIQIDSYEILIKNNFFQSDNINDLYSEDNLPIIVYKSEWVISNKTFPLVSLFGHPNITIEEDKTTVEADIISSTYFMLSRWEETLVLVRDNHNRFPAMHSLAYKNKFLDRPIVNEYVEILWRLIQNAGYTGSRREREFRIIPTHDIDRPFLWDSYKSVGQSFYNAIKYFNHKSLYHQIDHLLRGRDPYNNIDLLIDLSEKSGLKATFFILVGNKSKYDIQFKLNDNRFIAILNRIKEKGHFIGIHPSYESYLNNQELEQEIKILTSLTGGNITATRQHYLRLQIPNTLRILDKQNLEWDSTLGYPSRNGFRAGICYPFKIFDIKKREVMALYEKPLLIMDATLKNYEKRTVESSIEAIDNIKNKVKKYKGEFVFNWHNSSFYLNGWASYKKVFDYLYN